MCILWNCDKSSRSLKVYAESPGAKLKKDSVDKLGGRHRSSIFDNRYILKVKEAIAKVLNQVEGPKDADECISSSGEAFFSGNIGADFVRFSYAKTDADLEEACRRLVRAGR